MNTYIMIKAEVRQGVFEHSIVPVDLNNLLESLLTMNGCLRRLDCETQDMYVTLPRNDLHYIMRVAEQSPNGRFFKFYKRIGEDEFTLGSVKVRGY